MKGDLKHSKGYLKLRKVKDEVSKFEKSMEANNHFEFKSMADKILKDTKKYKALYKKLKKRHDKALLKIKNAKKSKA